MREMLEGGPLDVLTGDYLAELTMLILGRDTMKDPSLGYARTFVRQAEDCLGLALERGVTDRQQRRRPQPRRPRRPAPRGRRRARASTRRSPTSRATTCAAARPPTARSPPTPTSAASASPPRSTAGADVVVTGRVTDASLVVGPAVAHHGWTPDAVRRARRRRRRRPRPRVRHPGHRRQLLRLRRAADRRRRPLGFPLAEIAADGCSVITKHDGTGGAVTVDTVTAQLLYEIQSTRYLGPDVTVDLASIALAQDGPDRVAVSGVRGSAPPERLKVCVNELGGFRNSVELVLTGLDVEAKAAWVREQLDRRARPGAGRGRLVAGGAAAARRRHRGGRLGAAALHGQGPAAEPVGRAFTAAAVELALASYPGFTMTAPPGPASPYGIYRAAYVDRAAVTHTVVHADGRREVDRRPAESPPRRPRTARGTRPSPYPHPTDTLTRRLPLGTFVHARSGDKGGDANLGLWVAHDGPPGYDARVAWLSKLITPARVRELVPEAADLDVEVFLLPNLGGVNVVLHGLLGDGVAAVAPASTRRPRGSASGSARGWSRSRRACCDRRAARR